MRWTCLLAGMALLLAAWAAPSAAEGAKDGAAVAQERFRSAEALYHRGDYEAAAVLAEGLLAETAAGARGLLAWRAAALSARIAYHRESALPEPGGAAPGEAAPPLARFRHAFYLSLSEDPAARERARLLLEGLQAELPDRPLVEAALVVLLGRMTELPSETLASRVRRLTETTPDLPESWEAAALLAQEAGDLETARLAGERMLALERAEGRAEERLLADEIRLAAYLSGSGREAAAEEAFAAILETLPPPLLRAEALVHLAVIAFRRVGEAGSGRRTLRRGELEAARRFFEAAAADLAGLPGRRARTLRTLAEDWLAANYDASGPIILHEIGRPADDEADPQAWLDHAVAERNAGNAQAAVESALRAYALAVAVRQAESAAAALLTVLPDLRGLLADDRLAELWNAWEEAFGSLEREGGADTVADLARRRVRALRQDLEGAPEEAVLDMAAYLFSAERVRGLPADRLTTALFELAQRAYWLGLYEVTAGALDRALALTEIPSLREPMLKLASMEKVRPFFGLDSVGHDAPVPLALALERLRDLPAGAHPMQRWQAASAAASAMRRAEASALAEIDETDFLSIEAAYETLSSVMADSHELPPLQAGLAKAAGRVLRAGVRPQWAAFLERLRADLRQGAIGGGFQRRVLHHDAERDLAEVAGDRRGAVREAAATALLYFDRGNLDVTPFLLHVQAAQRQEGQIVEAALTAALAGEALLHTRLQMGRSQSRERFFRDRYPQVDLLLGSLETDLTKAAGNPALTGFLATIYWDLAENLKGRFLLDRQRLAAGAIATAEADEADLFKTAARAVLSLLAGDAPALPDWQSLFAAYETAVAPQRPAWQALLEGLAPRHPFRLEQQSLPDLQARLDARTAVLTIVARPRLEDDRGGLLLVTAEAVQFAPLPSLRWQADIIEPLLQGWHGDDPAATREKLAFLYRALLAPFEPRLAEVERLMVAPSGPFNDLPYAALWNEATERYLIEETELALVPFGKLAALPSERPAAPKALLYAVNAEGSPAGWTEADWRTRLGLSRKAALRAAGFADLSAFASAEAGALRRAWTGALDDLASEGALTRPRLLEKLQTADAAHLSMHGMTTPLSDGEDAFLFLSSSAGAEGLLRPRDLDAVDLTNLALLVLSACEVGRSYGAPAQVQGASTEARWLDRLAETGGFPKAFLLSGVRAMIAPVAAVAAGSDAALWAHFYRRLGDGATPETALAEAQRQLIAATSGPQSWGLYLLYRL